MGTYGTYGHRRSQGVIARTVDLHCWSAHNPARMKRQRQFLSFKVLLLVFGPLLFVIVWHSRQPTYEGKTVAQWFQDFSKAKAKYYIIPPTNGVKFGSTNLSQTWFVMDPVALRNDQAANALRNLGTNAAVYLAEEMCRRDPVWAPAYRSLFFKLPSDLRKIAPSAPPNEYTRSSEAAFCMSVLGHDAAAAAPILIGGLNACDSLKLASMINALRPLPFRIADIDAALERMIERGQTTNAIRIVTELSVRTPNAARILAKALCSSDSATRQSAVTQLERFGSDATPALPELTKALEDSNDEVRYKAACTLANLGTNAQPAFQKLNHTTNDTSAIVRGAANRALRGLSPTATAGTGLYHR